MSQKPLAGYKNRNIKAVALRSLSAGGYALMSFVVAVALSWLVLVPLNFGYGLWHDIGGIKEGIERYGPQNRFKPGFTETSREQRIALFEAINHSVHSGGAGLAEITYRTATSGGQQHLLRNSEIVHLQDVANLIDVLKWAALLISLLWLAATATFWKSRRFPNITLQFKGLFALLGPATVILFIAGPENVFNRMHELIFPAGHQWFFYYQESLMSTMMLAPVLFAWIAAAMLAISLLIFACLQYALWLADRYLRQHPQRQVA
ncbi:uncharacterized protein DUF1461 [Alteromonadaceae bacterium 2753L.S.0a.02]|nr:uncharacterized protein DUF1461 [Alteromonadaceae bacterium 2753L.S.0a.02]